MACEADHAIFIDHVNITFAQPGDALVTNRFTDVSTDMILFFANSKLQIYVATIEDTLRDAVHIIILMWASDLSKSGTQ